MMSMPMIHPPQAWAILRRHVHEIEPLRLADLLSDADRVSSLVAVYDRDDRMLMADLSRQRMTLETLNHLLLLATSRKLRSFITQLAWGPNDPRRRARTVDLPSMHLALRVPKHQGYEMFYHGENALTGIHREWDRLERYSESIRKGQLRGVTGSMIQNVVVIGRGVALAALKFVYNALLKDERAVTATRVGLVEGPSARLRRNLTGVGALPQRRLVFLTSVDPVAAAQALADLEPASTLVISIALNGNEETGLATKMLKTWLLQALGTNRRADHILAKHMALVTGNDRIVSVINKPESVHVIPEHSRCEAFTTFTPAGLLPLSVVFGWPIVKDFLAGAHDMDRHFVETNPRHNLPVLLALLDIWNDVLGVGRVVVPFTQALEGYPGLVAALESQTCGRASSSEDRMQSGRGSLVMDGSVDDAYSRALYQGDAVMNTEMLMTMDSQVAFNAGNRLGSASDDVHASQDTLMCSLFAHLDELALGHDKVMDSLTSSPRSDPGTTPTAPDSEGNRPSLLLMVGKLDAFACGQLVALAEHRAIVKAHLWDVDPFAKETGSSLHVYRTDQLKETLEEIMTRGVDESEDKMNLSTKTLLQHYASVTRDQRLYTVTGSSYT